MTTIMRGAPRLRRWLGLTAALLAAAGCTLFDTDISNPNAVSEDALNDPAGAATLANGLGGAVTRAFTSVYGPYSVASDELTWVGSREYWKNIDDGDLTDPVNEYTDAAYPLMSETRWLSNYTIDKLKAFDGAGTLPNRIDLARTYLYAAIAYMTIGDMYDDFVIGSDRTTSAAPIGETNMSVMYDSALAYLDRALPIAQATANQEVQRQVLGLRARVKFSKAVWKLLKPARTTPANPLVNDAGANADATAALALMGAGYRFRLTPVTTNTGTNNFAGEMNSRGEIRAGSDYIIPDASGKTPLAGIAGIKLLDPVTGQPDPVILAAINECCRVSVGVLVGITVITAKEMNLILAEAALAQSNTGEFTTRINAVRTADGLPAWNGTTPAARDLLIHERRVNLFLQGRRLHDLYRFGLKDSRWLASAIAARKACFFPISFIERQVNLLAQQPAIARPPYCT